MLCIYAFNGMCCVELCWFHGFAGNCVWAICFCSLGLFSLFATLWCGFVWCLGCSLCLCFRYSLCGIVDLVLTVVVLGCTGVLAGLL